MKHYTMTLSSDDLDLLCQALRQYRDEHGTLFNSTAEQQASRAATLLSRVASIQHLAQQAEENAWSVTLEDSDVLDAFARHAPQQHQPRPRGMTCQRCGEQPVVSDELSCARCSRFVCDSCGIRMMSLWVCRWCAVAGNFRDR